MRLPLEAFYLYEDFLSSMKDKTCVFFKDHYHSRYIYLQRTIMICDYLTRRWIRIFLSLFPLSFSDSILMMFTCLYCKVTTVAASHNQYVFAIWFLIEDVWLDIGSTSYRVCYHYIFSDPLLIWLLSSLMWLLSIHCFVHRKKTTMSNNYGSRSSENTSLMLSLSPSLFFSLYCLSMRDRLSLYKQWFTSGFSSYLASTSKYCIYTW